MSTNTGMNLLDPGETPQDNAQFILFLCAVIKVVDDYQDMLRVSVATAGNDHRLGASEAPPAVVSMFLGDELTAILDSIENDTMYDPKEEVLMRIGVHVLPKFPKDTTDRNRTSPLAFTGNKFEFRMPGSSLAVSSVNVVLNTAVAKVLEEFADELEKAEDFQKSLHDLIVKTIREHKRIIFNGNGYDDAWIKEATEVRGLSNLKTTPEALSHYTDAKNIELFTSMKVFSEAEMVSRCNIRMQNYIRVERIEARTMVEMAEKLFIPAISKYSKVLADTIISKKSIFAEIDCTFEETTLKKLSVLSGDSYRELCKLKELLAKLKTIKKDFPKAAFFIKDEMIPCMNALRAAVDGAEKLCASEYWPVPTYGEILFSVK
jgi:glutamine synthetase